MQKVLWDVHAEVGLRPRNCSQLERVKAPLNSDQFPLFIRNYAKSIFFTFETLWQLGEKKLAKEVFRREFKTSRLKMIGETASLSNINQIKNAIKSVSLPQFNPEGLEWICSSIDYFSRALLSLRREIKVDYRGLVKALNFDEAPDEHQRIWFYINRKRFKRISLLELGLESSTNEKVLTILHWNRNLEELDLTDCKHLDTRAFDISHNKLKRLILSGTSVISIQNKHFPALKQIINARPIQVMRIEEYLNRELIDWNQFKVAMTKADFIFAEKLETFFALFHAFQEQPTFQGLAVMQRFLNYFQEGKLSKRHSPQLITFAYTFLMGWKNCSRELESAYFNLLVGFLSYRAAEDDFNVSIYQLLANMLYGKKDFMLMEQCIRYLHPLDLDLLKQTGDFDKRLGPSQRFLEYDRFELYTRALMIRSEQIGDAKFAELLIYLAKNKRQYREIIDHTLACAFVIGTNRLLKLILEHFRKWKSRQYPLSKLILGNISIQDIPTWDHDTVLAERLCRYSGIKNIKLKNLFFKSLICDKMGGISIAYVEVLEKLLSEDKWKDKAVRELKKLGHSWRFSHRPLARLARKTQAGFDA